jgi:flagellar basal-body rod modification protein FlgD
MTITGNTSATSSSYTPTAAESGRVPKQTLGQDDFLKLITVQLTQQDPLKPMEDTAFIGQMAQFTSLEQSSGMAKDMAALRSDFSRQSASGMIGRDVTLKTAAGQITGPVSSVDTSGGSVKIGVNGTYYPLSQVIRVAPAATAS